MTITERSFTHLFMRVKDENKSDAIFNATIELLNEIGFTDISMSKIAKRAGLSSSTIYVYFENKDDMLKKTYLYVKSKILSSAYDVFEEKLPVRETIALFMRRYFIYLVENKSYFLFSEQFGNSPLLSKFYLKDLHYSLISSYHEYFDAAKEKGILKNVDTALLIAYCSYPVVFLVKLHFSCHRDVTEEVIEQAVRLSWEAIKA